MRGVVGAAVIFIGFGAAAGTFSQDSLTAAASGTTAAAVGAAPSARFSHLRANLDALVAHPARGNESWSVLAVSLDRGDTLYAHQPKHALTPASNMKLLTSAAALHYLGADYRFSTFLLTDGRLDNGVLLGDVYLYGTGDPTLGRRFQESPSGALEAFADSLEALGVREIRGAVVGDGSYFTGAGSGEGWQNSYLGNWYAAPAGALSVHENLVRLVIRPGPAPGTRPEVEYIPGGRGIAVVNLASTGGGGRITVRRFGFDAPILIEGRIDGGTSAHAVPVGDPARFAAAVFRDLLEERGIAVTGGLRTVEDPAHSPISRRRVHAPAFDTASAARVLAIHVSTPLIDILTVINHQSHNFYSEQVLRAVGRVATGEGSVRGGSRAVRAMLEQTGVDVSTLQIHDGCGLSPLNQVSAEVFIGLLAFMERSPWSDAFESTLPVAGEVRRFRRMGGTPAQGNLRAKTGTIDRVSALSGYVHTRDGEKIAFSIISNNVGSTANSKHVENLIGAALADFHRGGAPAAAPVPQAPASLPATTSPAAGSPADTAPGLDRQNN